jgi:PncC family amidohydrolase
MGIVAYANQTKSGLLNVPADILERFGAVSPQTATAMANGVQKLDNSTYGVATTGIAGPSGGSSDKPVGLVYIAVVGPLRTRVEKYEFPGRRIDIQRRTAQMALAVLREEILRSNIEH